MWASHKLYWESVSFFPESGRVNVWKKTYDAATSASCRLDCSTGLAATDLSMHGSDPVGLQCRTARENCGVISIHKAELPSRRMDVFTTLLFKYCWVGFSVWGLLVRDFTGLSSFTQCTFFASCRKKIDLKHALNSNYKKMLLIYWFLHILTILFHVWFFPSHRWSGPAGWRVRIIH